MSLDNVEVVDAVGTDRVSGEDILSILDSWDWGDPRTHLVALQSKLNAYFGFIESGQIYETYPEAVGRLLRIDIVSRYPMPDAALTFLEKVSAVASELNLTVTQRVR